MCDQLSMHLKAVAKERVQAKATNKKKQALAKKLGDEADRMARHA